MIVLPLDVALYDTRCPECGGKLHNDTFDPDADGPLWFMYCDECPGMFSFRVKDVIMEPVGPDD